MDVRMDGRNAIITGGSRGLGRAMAMRFAESGAGVAIVARREDVLAATKAEIEAAAPSAAVITCTADVSSADGVKSAFDQAINGLGQIDIVVNNAGSSMARPFEEVTDEMWQADLELKLFGAIRMIRLALPGMKERSWGRIINILNTGAKSPRAGSTPTTVSRAAGLNLTKSLSLEYAPHGILVNALCTGLIVTDQLEKMRDRGAPEKSMEEYQEILGGRIPLGRMGTADEYANVACLLASDAGGYVTGTAINIDGGSSPAT
ncbi:MAG: SDR family oxidoreductase [Rhodospirillaceae bacterium]|jgi:NAD(P)-dependent dehydrogenase (short-subunit alcohol dehydrogenase family)|nr:SDR family oxidoreductase [Rhodospirillaceae bacterium]MBT3885122.1 SDR family oxidoreductase [Rhodospirillaceae bacterium]MBT4116976.1 SDR family oxidoreductase [Rhodospirillaceae bacterium]MBT4672201.1 SDR family oxidoreductase [Rhodospirillaceae bacterium]MBT4719405.1 SDR family oxidoreductase [Rhodospirillaceae bacterium]